MPRTARAIVKGYCYHVLNRSNGRVRIFHDHRDYACFVALLADAQADIPVEILAVCLMPNHVHAVLRPTTNDGLAQWAHWVFTSHVRRHHKRYSTSGRLWQGRFKTSVIQQDGHLLTVLRYVERNAFTARLSDRAETWRWGSLNWRLRRQAPVALTESPLPLPSNWVEYVNEPQSLKELAEIRRAISRERPIGSEEWVKRAAVELGFEYSIRPRGRPRKSAADGSAATSPLEAFEK
jgi:putative transposase